MLTTERVCEIVALACEQATNSHQPVSPLWSRRELADDVVAAASPTATCRVPRQVVKRTTSNRIACLNRSTRPPTPTARQIADICAWSRTAVERADAHQHTMHRRID